MMTSRMNWGSSALLGLLTLAVVPVLSKTSETTSFVGAAAAEGKRPDFADGLYDISGYDELSLDVSRLTAQPLYRSTLGYYLASRAGRPLGGKIIWSDASIGKSIKFNVDLNLWPEAEALGFFLIPHGAARNQELQNRDVVSFALFENRWTAFQKQHPLKGRNVPLIATDARLNANGVRQALIDADASTLHWAERPTSAPLTYDDLGQNITIQVRKAASSKSIAAPLDFTSPDAAGAPERTKDLTEVAPKNPSQQAGTFAESSPGVYAIKGAKTLTLDLKNHGSKSPFKSSFGFYLTNAADQPIRGRVIWADVTQATSKRTVTISERMLKNTESLGFFILPNGAPLNPDLRDDTRVSFANYAGEWTVLRNGTSLNAASLPAFFSDIRWNADEILHSMDSPAPGNMNWEEKYRGANQNYDDVNLDVAVTIDFGDQEPELSNLVLTPRQSDQGDLTEPESAEEEIDSAQTYAAATAGTVIADAETVLTDTAFTGSVDEQGFDGDLDPFEEPVIAEFDEPLSSPTPTDGSFWNEPVLSGYVEAESSTFPVSAQFARQSNERIQQTIAGKIEYAKDVGESSELLVNLAGRYDQVDDHRSFVDMQVAHYAYFGDIMTLRAGVLNDTWGVLELENITDIVNQRNIVDDFRADTKLGQPGINLGFRLSDFGQTNFYYLPYPRQRPFPGDDGRFQIAAIPVDDDNAFYKSAAGDNVERWGEQAAGRVQFLFGNLEASASHFFGTSRDPRFDVILDGATPTALAPRYDQINQSGIELRTLAFDNVLKVEAFRRTGKDPIKENDAFYGAAAGIEREFVRVFGGDTGLTLFGEYYYDNRDFATDAVAPVSLDNDIFIGGRFAFNDLADTELVAATTVDIDTQATRLSLEIQRRFGADLQFTLKGDSFINADADPAQIGFQDDHRILLRARYFY